MAAICGDGTKLLRFRLANTPPVLKSQLWSEDFTAKLFCNVEFWLERLPKLVGLGGRPAIVIPHTGCPPFTLHRNKAVT